MTTTSLRPRDRRRTAVGLAQRAVERLARRSDEREQRRDAARPRISRRSLLVRSAVVGSVLTIAPLRWATRPATAYSEICGQGWRCSQGWTAFCCTINDGANTCPPGSYVAGWWKIDRSPYCQGAPRYIIDCNRSPGASCRCRCADEGTCDQRRVCCNNFRYGQCNTQIPGVTEVVCRVVLCTTPWSWDPACGRTLRTDNRTTTHNAPCLPGRNATAIDLTYQELGLTGSVLGAPDGPERSGPRGGTWRRYERGVITWQQATGAVVLTGAVGRRYGALEGPSGPLGYPRAELPDERGRRFERGGIYRSGSAAIEVLGPTDQRYHELGGPTGVLGVPTEATTPVGDGRGSRTRFAEGAVFASGRGAFVVAGVHLTRYDALGGPVDSGLGYPLADVAELGGDLGQRQRFETGSLYLGGAVSIEVLGAADVRYDALGGPGGVLGGPIQPTVAVGGEGTDAPAGTVTRFVAGTIYASRSGAYELSGRALERYEALGGPLDSGLGFPLGAADPDQEAVQRFAQGLLVEVDGEVVVLRRRIARRYLDVGGLNGPWGTPTGDQARTDGAGPDALEQAAFTEVDAFASRSTGVRVLDDPIRGAYRDAGGPDGELGRPTADSFTNRSGAYRGTFQHGAIEVHPTTGQVRVLRPRPTRSPSELTSRG